MSLWQEAQDYDFMNHAPIMVAPELARLSFPAGSKVTAIHAFQPDGTLKKLAGNNPISVGMDTVVVELHP